MVPRRKETTTTIEQPVRLYKAIALTFLGLTVVLLAVIVFMSTKRATITVETKSAPVTATTRVNVGGRSRDAVAGRVVATIVNASDNFQPTGTREEPAVATGTVKIHNDTGAAQALVRTTRLLSPEGILFRLNQRVLVPAGGTAEVDVYADQPGASGNIGSTRFTIPGLRPDKQSVIYAVSELPMSGGVRQVGVVSKEDITDAESRLLAYFLELGQKQLKEGERVGDFASVFTITEPSFQSSVEVGEEVSDFTVVGQGTAVGVFYDNVALEKIAREQLLKRAVDDAEVIEPATEPPSVSITTHNVEKDEATLEVIIAGNAMLNPESRQLEKSIFFGKTKDEVRRYLLRLDHVQGVAVRFRPAWMRTVPQIAEHVNVVVKSIE